MRNKEIINQLADALESIGYEIEEIGISRSSNPLTKERQPIASVTIRLAPLCI